MATNEKVIEMSNRLKSIKSSSNPETDHIIAGADDIYDDEKGKKQSQFNADTDATLANHETIINGLNTQNYVTVTATDQTTAVTQVLPATGSVDTVYRVGNWDGSQYDVTCYSEYSWNGSAYVHISTKTQIGEVFDISAYKASGGTLVTFADLTAALGTNGANVPASIRKGGMSVKFVQTTPATYNVVKTEGVTEQPTGTELDSASSIGSGTYTASQLSGFSTLPTTSTVTYYVAVTEDETTTYTTWVITLATAESQEYVQYRLMSTAWSDVVGNWQGVDSEPVAGSENLVESGGVADVISSSIVIGKKFVKLTNFYGYVTKNGYSITSEGNIQSQSSTKYRTIFINKPINKGAILHFTGEPSENGRFAVGISKVPITDENITSIQLTLLCNRVFTSNMDIYLNIPFDGYIAYYRYTDYWTNIDIEACNITPLQDNSILDISELNNTVYNSLDDAIEAIPTTLQKGGMVIRFKQFIPATYYVTVTESNSEPSGIQLETYSDIVDGKYEASQLSDFTNLPSATGEDNSVVYYFENDSIYTIWTIKMLAENSSEYVQYRLINTEWDSNTNSWQSCIDEVSDFVFESIFKSKSYTEIDITTLTKKARYILSSGKWSSNANTSHRTIPTTGGEFFAITASDKTASYAFILLDNPSPYGDVSFVDGTGLMSIKPGDTSFIKIPDGCKFLYITESVSSSGVVIGGYLPKRLVRSVEKFNSGEPLDSVSIVNEVSNNPASLPTSAAVFADNSLTRKNLNWVLHPYYNRIKLTSTTFLSYTPCKKDDLFRIVNDAATYYGFCSTKPTSTADIEHINIASGDYVIKAPSDGYLCIKTDNSAFSVIFKSDTNIFTELYKNVINVSGIKNRVLIINEDSENYNTLWACNNNNFIANEEYIDISDYTYIGLFVYFSTNSFLYQNRDVQDIPGVIFYDEEYNVVSASPLLSYNTVYKRQLVRFAVPTNAKYMRASFNVSRSLFIGYTSNYKKTPDTDEVIEMIAEALGGESITETIKNVMTSEAATTDAKTIFELNTDTEMLQKMAIAKKKWNNGASGSSDIPTFIFAHISDTHGSATQYARFIEFAEHWKEKGYINEIIDTGDVVNTTYTDGTVWRDSIDGVENVITVVGNHDTRSGVSETVPTGQNIWQYHSAISLDETKRADVYRLLMVGPDSENPYINNWGVTQPESAAENGLCYYYKDYESQKIRIIGIDVMGYNDTQNAWLQSVLAETLDNNNAAYGYHVLILSHFTGGQMSPLLCNYTSLRTTGVDYGSSYNENLYKMPITVDEFQTNGGVFIGYIIGHYHRDMVNILESYPKQLAFAVSSGGRTPIRDFTKVVGCKSYDDFQIVSVNTYDKTVRLIKVGADIDYYMRKKGTLCVSYDIITDDNIEKVKGVIGEGW